MVCLRQVLPPLCEQGRFGEQFGGFFLFWSLLLVLDLVLELPIVLMLLFDLRLFILCSFYLPVPILYEKFVNGILLRLESFENSVWTEVDKQKMRESKISQELILPPHPPNNLTYIH